MASGERAGVSTRDDATADFFGGLATRGEEPLLRAVSGTLRFDLRVGRRVEHWYVAVRRGAVTVSHEDAPADLIVRVERSLFDGMAEGRVNPIAALLRGTVDTEGDLGLLMRFQRLLPGPPGARGPVRAGQGEGST